MTRKEFPATLFGRFTKTGHKTHWSLTGYLPDNDHRYPGGAIYRSEDAGSSFLTGSGLLYGIQNGHLLAMGGKEVLAWGDDFGAQLQRLCIQAWLFYEGKDTTPSVYWLTDSDFAKLCDDPAQNWDGKDAAWRYAEGATPMVHADGHKRVRVAGRYLEAWKDGGYGYKSLLSCLCDCMGCSTERNVAALTAELATMNGMTIGALFTKYQPA